jgi:hypothetical protein
MAACSRMLTRPRWSFDVDAEPGHPADRPGVLVEGRGEPDLVERRRVQLEGELAQAAEALGDRPAQPVEQLGLVGAVQVRP